MDDGIFARLRRLLSPSSEPAGAATEQVEGDLPVEDEPALPAVDAEAPAEDDARQAPVEVAPEPPAEEKAPSVRRLPSFHPVTAAHEGASDEAAGGPLSLSLTEAITLVRNHGGDTIELGFLQKELDRRVREGSEPDDLWPRIEQAVSGRLRRAGKLAEGQSLVLERDR
jgi:hypothetical protein